MTMKQLKELIKKNTLLAFATCIALSSIVGGCANACEQGEQGKSKVTIAITKAEKNIKGDEVATIKLQLKEGDVKLSEVRYKWTGADGFVTADGKPLPETLAKSEGKTDDDDDDEDMEDDKVYEIKVKAADATQNGNVTKTLKLALGDEEKEDAFASEQDVVTWEASTPPLSLSLDARVTIFGTKEATKVLTNTGGTTAKQKNVHFTFTEFESFEYSSDGGKSWNNVEENMTLDTLTGGGPANSIGTSHNLTFRRKAVGDRGTKTLGVTIGSSAGAADYLAATDIVTSDSSLSEGDLSITATFQSKNWRYSWKGDIHADQVLEVILHCTGKKAKEIKCSEIMVKFKNDSYKYISKLGNSALQETMSLKELLRLDDDQFLEELDWGKRTLYFKIVNHYKQLLPVYNGELSGTLEYEFSYINEVINAERDHRGSFTFTTGNSCSKKVQV